MKCPKCGKNNDCGCNSCRKYKPSGDHQHYVTYKYPEAEKHGYAILACPHCGFEAGEDYWLSVEADYYKKRNIFSKILNHEKKVFKFYKYMLEYCYKDKKLSFILNKDLFISGYIQVAVAITIIVIIIRMV